MRALALLATAALLALLAPGAASTTTRTECFGGARDPYALTLSPPLGDLLRKTPGWYLAYRDGTFWFEENGAPGLQRTDRVCYTQTYADDGTILASESWVDLPSDAPVTP